MTARREGPGPGLRRHLSGARALTAAACRFFTQSAGRAACLLAPCARASSRTHPGALSSVNSLTFDVPGLELGAGDI